jgi:hypothetical protein
MRSLRRFVLVTVALRILLSVAALAQDVPTPKVDQIFSVYDKPGSPGCSLGAIRNGVSLFVRSTLARHTRSAIPSQCSFWEG